MKPNKKFKRTCIRCGKKFIPTGPACKLCDACWFKIRKLSPNKRRWYK